MTKQVNLKLVHSSTAFPDDVEALLGPARDGILDRRLAITLFPNLSGRGGKLKQMNLHDLAGLIQAAKGTSKEALPLLKMATFEGPRSDANMRFVSGVEIDYDGGEVSIEEASQRLRAAGVGGLLYSTPSSTAAHPKWRFLAPTSEDLSPCEREALAAKLNGVLGVILDPASFIPSQAFYYGSTGGDVPNVLLLDGRFVNLADDLAEVWPPTRERDRKPSKGTKTGLSREDFAEAVWAVENDDRFADRTDWLRFGVAIHHETDGDAEGFALFDEWSKGHPSYDPEATEKAWDSIRNHRSDGSTVLHFAAQSGWKPSVQDRDDDFDDEPEVSTPARADSKSSFGFEPVSTWTGTPPVREWVVVDVIPHRNVTTLYGDGGTGKSLLALQLAVAIPSGGTWIGRTPSRRGKVLFLSGEDEQAELHRRVLDIAGTTAGLSDLLARSVVGEDCVLARADPRTGRLKPTTRFDALVNDIAQHQPTVVVLDTLYDFFDGNQNDPALARAFVNMLRGLAVRYNCAVLLLAHPSQSGMNDGSGQAGARAWNNAVRSRLYLERVKGEDGTEDNPDARVLRTMKTNYAKAGGEVPLHWVKGRFVAQDVFTEHQTAETREEKARRVFLKLLDALASERRGHVTPKPGTSTSAPIIFAKRRDSEGLKQRDFQVAMDALYADGTIRTGEHKSGGHTRFHIERA